MRQTLTKDRPVLFHIVDDARVDGSPPGLTGDLGLLHGDATHVRGHLDRFKGGSTFGDVSGLRGDISRPRGQVNHIHGDVPEGLSGYMTWIRGDVSNLRDPRSISSATSAPFRATSARSPAMCRSYAAR